MILLDQLHKLLLLYYLLFSRSSSEELYVICVRQILLIFCLGFACSYTKSSILISCIISRFFQFILLISSRRRGTTLQKFSFLHITWTDDWIGLIVDLFPCWPFLVFAMNNLVPLSEIFLFLAIVPQSHLQSSFNCALSLLISPFDNALAKICLLDSLVWNYYPCKFWSLMKEILNKARVGVHKYFRASMESIFIILAL